MLIRELGRGGMGTVYLARDERLHRDVAIKVISTEGPAATERFIAEARVTARCKHANIVDIYDIADDGGQPYMVLEYVAGHSVRDLLEQGPPPVERTIALMTQVARGLAFAHSRGVIHRDLKPANILVAADGAVKIADFGIAKPFDEREVYTGAGAVELPRDITASSELPGTLHYIAPEHARGEPSDDRADLWAFGVTLFQLLSGLRPLDGLAQRDVLAHLADLDREVPRLDTVTRGLPPALIELTHRCLEKRLELRIGSAAELVVALEALAPRPVELLPPPPPPPRAADRRTSRWMVAAAALVALAAVGWWIAGRRAGAPAERGDDSAATARASALVAELARLDGNGDHAAGDRLLGEFLVDERDPHAQALAWLVRGDRERARRGAGRDAAMTSYASAYARAADRDVRRRALLAVARLYLEDWDWDRLAAALDGFEGGAPDPELEALRERLRLAVRDPAAAQAGTTTARFAGAVLHGRPTAVRALSALTLDVDGDGAREVVALEDGAVVVRRADTLAELARRPAPGVTELRCGGRDRHGAHVVAAAAAGVSALQLISLDGTANEVPWPPGWMVNCRWIDLDGDGDDELYLLTASGMVRLARGAGGWAAETLAVGAEVWDVIGGDLDGDGRRELVLSIGEWRAYEVRLMRADAGGALRTVDRLRVGVVGGLAALGPDGAGGARIAALELDVYPNVRDLPPDRPLGVPAGFYVLALRGDRLELGPHVPLPELAGDGWHRLASSHFADLGAMHAADVDGDGRRDVVVRLALDPRHPHLVAMIAEDGGGFAPQVVSDLAVYGAVESDGDGAAELLARIEGEPGLWLLGGGDVAVPRRPTAAVPRSALGLPPPSVAPPWWRAELLARIGHAEAAAEALRRIAALTSSPAVKLRALRRATDLLRAARLPAAATLEAIGQLSGQPDSIRAGAWLAAVEDDLEQLALVDGLARVERLGAAGLTLTAAEQARLAAVRARLPDWPRPVFGPGGLDPAWRIADPSLVHVVPGSGELAIETLTDGEVASLPLLAGDRGLAVIIEAQLTRMEWASNLDVRLTPRRRAAGSAAAVEIGARGGGRLYRRGYRCSGTDESRGERYEPLPDSDQPVSVRIELVVMPGGRRARCSVIADGRAMTVPLDLEPSDDDVWELSIGAGVLADMTSATMRVSSIEVAGATPVRDAPSALAAAALALAAHRPAEARDHLRRADAGTWAAARLAAMAAEEAGDRPAAVALLRSALDRAGRPTLRQLATLGRVRDGQFLPLLRAVHGRRVATLLAAMWTVTAHHELDQPRVQSAILRDLDGLPDATPETREATLSLLGVRGEALLAVGRPEGARRALEAALALLPPDPPPPLRDRAERIAHLLAVEAAARADEPAARRWALASLELANYPELAADQVLLDPVLARLAAGPGWERVRDLGRLLSP